jgi:hypothetical protein
MKKILTYGVTTLAAFLLFPSFTFQVNAQANRDDITQTVLLRDALFWNAYNDCNVAAMQPFFTDDVEFYHDKGGPTFGLANLVDSFRKMCDSRKQIHVRREAAKDTVKVFPMKSSDVIYGAIISGDHYFYTQEEGKKEHLEGLARFTHLWLLKDGQWKMSRVLSFDHGSPPYVNKREAIKLSAGTIRRYLGVYVGPKSNVAIGLDNNLLTLHSGSLKMVLYPESKSVFFSKERDLTFEFAQDANGKVNKMVVRENRDVVEELIRQK